MFQFSVMPLLAINWISHLSTSWYVIVYVNSSLPGFDAVYCCRKPQTFRRNLCLYILHWRKQQVSPKHRYLSTRQGCDALIRTFRPGVRIACEEGKCLQLHCGRLEWWFICLAKSTLLDLSVLNQITHWLMVKSINWDKICRTWVCYNRALDTLRHPSSHNAAADTSLLRVAVFVMRDRGNVRRKVVLTLSPENASYDPVYTAVEMTSINN
jgi:hypothetical protein